MTNAANYSKGILSEILEFVMGQGLIPANGEVWKTRRRKIVPSLHKCGPAPVSLNPEVGCTPQLGPIPAAQPRRAQLGKARQGIGRCSGGYGVLLKAWHSKQPCLFSRTPTLMADSACAWELALAAGVQQPSSQPKDPACLQPAQLITFNAPI